MGDSADIAQVTYLPFAAVKPFWFLVAHTTKPFYDYGTLCKAFRVMVWHYCKAFSRCGFLRRVVL